MSGRIIRHVLPENPANPYSGENIVNKFSCECGPYKYPSCVHNIVIVFQRRSGRPEKYDWHFMPPNAAVALGVKILGVSKHETPSRRCSKKYFFFQKGWRGTVRQGSVRINMQYYLCLNRKNKTLIETVHFFLCLLRWIKCAFLFFLCLCFPDFLIVF